MRLGRKPVLILTIPFASIIFPPYEFVSIRFFRMDINYVLAGVRLEMVRPSPGGGSAVCSLSALLFLRRMNIEFKRGPRCHHGIMLRFFEWEPASSPSLISGWTPVILVLRCIFNTVGIEVRLALPVKHPEPEQASMFPGPCIKLAFPEIPKHVKHH